MKLLELFSGTGSIGRAFEALGWEVTSLDLEGEPTIKCDILDWDHTAFPPGHFQVVWASPVCCEFSKALTRRPRRLEEGDRLVLRTLELIDYFKPRFWGLENPQTGLLKTRPYMEGLPFQDVTYCSYGSPYRKRTRVWGTLPFVPRPPAREPWRGRDLAGDPGGAGRATLAPAVRASATGATPPGRSAAATASSSSTRSPTSCARRWRGR